MAGKAPGAGKGINHPPPPPTSTAPTQDGASAGSWNEVIKQLDALKDGPAPDALRESIGGRLHRTQDFLDRFVKEHDDLSSVEQEALGKVHTKIIQALTNGVNPKSGGGAFKASALRGLLEEVVHVETAFNNLAAERELPLIPQGGETDPGTPAGGTKSTPVRTRNSHTRTKSKASSPRGTDASKAGKGESVTATGTNGASAIDAVPTLPDTTELPDGLSVDAWHTELLDFKRAWESRFAENGIDKSNPVQQEMLEQLKRCDAVLDSYETATSPRRKKLAKDFKAILTSLAGDIATRMYEEIERIASERGASTTGPKPPENLPGQSDPWNTADNLGVPRAASTDAPADPNETTPAEVRAKNKNKFRLVMQAAKQAFGKPEKQLVQTYKDGAPDAMKTFEQHELDIKNHRAKVAEKFITMNGLTSERLQLKEAEAAYGETVKEYHQGRSVLNPLRYFGGKKDMDAAHKALAEKALAYRKGIQQAVSDAPAGANLNELNSSWKKDFNTLKPEERHARAAELRAAYAKLSPEEKQQHREALRARAIGLRDTVNSFAETKIQARTEALDAKGKTALGKTEKWAAMGPKLLFKGYNGIFNKAAQGVVLAGAATGALFGKEANAIDMQRSAMRLARATRLLASAGIATAVSGGGWLTLTPLLALARGGAGMAAGIGFGKVGGLAYMNMFGKKGSENLRDLRRETGELTAEDIMDQQDAQASYSREARMKTKALVENITGIVAGAGTSFGANYELHHLGLIPWHPNAHGGKVPEAKPTPNPAAVEKVAALKSVQEAGQAVAGDQAPSPDGITIDVVPTGSAVPGTGLPVPGAEHAGAADATPTSAPVASAIPGTTTPEATPVAVSGVEPAPAEALPAHVVPTEPGPQITGSYIHERGEGLDQLFADVRHNLSQDPGMKGPVIDHLRSLSPNALSRELHAALGDKFGGESATMHTGDGLVLDEQGNLWFTHADGQPSQIVMQLDPTAPNGFVTHDLTGTGMTHNPVAAPEHTLPTKADTSSTDSGPEAAAKPDVADSAAADTSVNSKAWSESLMKDPNYLSHGPVGPDGHPLTVDQVDHLRHGGSSQSADTTPPHSESPAHIEQPTGLRGTLTTEEAVAQLRNGANSVVETTNQATGTSGGSGGIGVDEAIRQFGSPVQHVEHVPAGLVNARGVELLPQPHQYAMGRFNAFYGQNYESTRAAALAYLQDHKGARVRMPSLDATKPGHVGEWTTELYLDSKGVAHQDIIREGNFLSGKHRVRFDLDSLDKIK